MGANWWENKKLIKIADKSFKANALLCILWHFVNIATIKSIYYAINLLYFTMLYYAIYYTMLYYAINLLCFHSHLSHVCTAQGQNPNSKHHINLLQKKAIWIISFTSFDAHTLLIFVKLNIIKFTGLTSFCNCLFICKHYLSVSLPRFFPIHSF